MAYRLIGRIGLIGLIGVCLVSCRTKYVSVPEYHTEYKERTDSFIKRDTVFKEKLKKVYNDHYIYTNKTDTVMKTDSVRVPFPVEKKLGRWEQIKMDYFVPICCVLAIILLSLLWLIKRRF